MHNKNIQKNKRPGKQYDGREEDKGMTKKEIIDKVYDDYLKDYGRVGPIGMDSIEKACKSEFEKNGIEYDHYDVQEALESKRNYNIVNAYVKGYSDTRESMDYLTIRDFMVQYKQGLDAGDIEYKDAEFKRVAKVFKMYEGYGRETDDKETKDAMDSLKKNVNLYLSETSSDKESVQNAYKAINDYIYDGSSFDNLAEQVKGIDPADMKEAFSKVIDDNDYLKSRLSRMENPNRNNSSFILDNRCMNHDMRDNLNEVYDKCIKDSIGDISKEPKEIQMAAKMHSFMEDYDKAYRDMNDYLEGKTTKLNEGKDMNQYAVSKAFENVMISHVNHDGDIEITDKHVDIGKNYDIPRTNSFPENEYQLTDALREVRTRVADSLAKDFSDDKETQEQFKEMYSDLHGSWSVRQGDPHERDSLDDRYSAFRDDIKDANKAAADAFLKVVECENVQKLLANIKEDDITHNLDVIMHSPDCNFYDLINAYEMSGAKEQIGNMITEACKNADDPNHVQPEEVGLTADEIRNIIKIEKIIDTEEELASTFDVINDYMQGDITVDEMKEILNDECQPEFIANAFADMLNENSRYCENTLYDDVEQKLKNIYKECDFDSPEFKEAFDNVAFYHLSDFVQIRNESRADNEFQKWMSDPERKSVADLIEAVYDSADHRADRDDVTTLIDQAIEHAPAEMIVDSQMTQKFADVAAKYSVPLSKIQSFDEVKESNPEVVSKFKESYKDKLKEDLAERIAVHAKWDVPYVFDGVRNSIENLYQEIDENDKADIIVSSANILENKRLTGEADMSKKDVALSLANACVTIGFTDDRSIDALDKAVEQSPQVKDITDDMMKTAVFKDMVMDYIEDYKGFLSNIENAIGQIDKSTVKKVMEDVSDRNVNAYSDKRERLEEVQKIADEYVKDDKMDFGQDEISYDDDDDHDDH